jgi:hypothetical protein
MSTAFAYLIYAPGVAMVTGSVYNSHVVPFVLIYVPLMPHVSVAVIAIVAEPIKTFPQDSPFVVMLTSGGVVSRIMVSVILSVYSSSLVRYQATVQLYDIKFPPTNILPSFCTARVLTILLNQAQISKEVSLVPSALRRVK